MDKKHDNISLIQLSNYVKPDVYEVHGRKWVLNGKNNSFFQYIIDRYNGSPTNESIINTYCELIYGKGISINGTNEIYPELNEIFNKREQKKCIADFKIFGMYAMQLIRSKGGGISYIEHIPINKLAMEKVDEKGNINNVYFCEDWENTYKKTPQKLPVFKGKMTESLMVKVVAPYKPGSIYYPPPNYMAGLQYAELEEEISNFCINHIQNSLSFGYIINFNNGGSLSDEQKSQIEFKIKQKLSGSSNAGKFILSFNDGKEAEVTVVPLEVNDAHSQYEFLSREAMNKIVVSHGAFPELFGLDTASGFNSNADELDVQSKLVQDYQIAPCQAAFIDELASVLELAGLETDLAFIPLRDTYKSTEEGTQEKADVIDDTIDSDVKMAGFDPNQKRAKDGKWATESGTSTKLEDKPCFKEWFSGSKIVDENGKPLKVYHGTIHDFDEFNLDNVGSSTDTGMFGKGFYFSDDFNEAKKYANRNNKKGIILETYLNFKNPFIIRDKNDIPEINIPEETIDDLLNAPYNYSKAFMEYVLNKGYDGVIALNTDGSKQYVAFNPNQIKSVDAESFCHESNINLSIENIKTLINLGEDINYEEWEVVDDRRCDEITIKEHDLNTVFEFASVPKTSDKKSEQDTSLFKIRYRYAGNPKPEREFCRKVMLSNKLFRAEDLNANYNYNEELATTGEDSYNIFNFKGGVNCKHWWQRVIFLKKGNKKISVNQAKKMILALDPEDREDARWKKNDKRVAQIAEAKNNYWSLKPNYRNSGVTELSVIDKIKAKLAGFDPNQKRAKDGKWATESGTSTKLEDRPCFKEWFKDSKVVDKNGNPISVFHGSPDVINAFDPDKTGNGVDQLGSGFYFTNNQDEAIGYSQGTNNVVNAYLSIKNPIIATGSNLNNTIDMTSEEAYKILKQSPLIYGEDSPLQNWYSEWWDVGTQDWMIRKLADSYTGANIFAMNNDFFDGEDTAFREALNDVLGFDGIIQDFQGNADGRVHYIAWFPEQIKSVDAESFCHESNINLKN